MIDKFTFYKNYYDILNYLPDNERLTLYDAILKYMFENQNPELNGLLKGIWVNIKMPLDTNKKNIINGKNGGRPKNPDETQNETQNKPKSKSNPKANNISYFLFLISNNKYKYININNNLYKKIEEWLNYKQERKEIYKPTGLQTLIKQIDNKVEIYGEKNIINLIDECMANNYKGIIFDKLNKFKKQENNLPEWFDKEIKEEETSDEVKELLKYVNGEN